MVGVSSCPLSNCGRSLDETNIPVSVIIHVLPCLPKGVCEVRARAEDAPVPGDDNALNPVVDVEELEGLLHFFHHGSCEGIVAARTVQRENLDRCHAWRVLGVVGDADFFVGEGGVGVWDVDGLGWGSHCGGLIWAMEG